MNTASLLATMESKRYAIDTREGALNLIGIRSTNRTAGKYDDFIAGLVRRQGNWELDIWQATTDPSTSYLYKPINSAGTAILVPGQYPDVWKTDNHNGWCYTLCQRNGSVRVYRDRDRDNHLDLSPSSIQTGMFGINFHWDKNEPSGKSGINYRASAGCQVFRYKTDHQKFMSLVIPHKANYGNLFTYTLLDERDLIPGRTRVMPSETAKSDGDLELALQKACDELNELQRRIKELTAVRDYRLSDFL